MSTLPSRKFVNNGLIAGTVEAVKRFLQWALENKYTDDQFALGNYMNTFPELVAADTAAELLHTTTFGVNAGIQDIHRQKQDAPTLAEVLGRGAFFLHVPGSSSKGQKVIYDLVCTLIDAGAGDAMLGGVYKYAEPEWNEVF